MEEDGVVWVHARCGGIVEYGGFGYLYLSVRSKRNRRHAFRFWNLLSVSNAASTDATFAIDTISTAADPLRTAAALPKEREHAASTRLVGVVGMGLDEGGVGVG